MARSEFEHRKTLPITDPNHMSNMSDWLKHYNLLDCKPLVMALDTMFAKIHQLFKIDPSMHHSLPSIAFKWVSISYRLYNIFRFKRSILERCFPILTRTFLTVFRFSVTMWDRLFETTKLVVWPQFIIGKIEVVIFESDWIIQSFRLDWWYW